mmetsp:Transcript_47066/g.114677  ORF Transcript_47066/g.114677 Transcript_47066/m.114677 type:complete len:365 (-) Transcript_47066:210-1304(-)
MGGLVRVHRRFDDLLVVLGDLDSLVLLGRQLGGQGTERSSEVGPPTLLGHGEELVELLLQRGDLRVRVADLDEHLLALVDERHVERTQRRVLLCELLLMLRLPRLPSLRPLRRLDPPRRPVDHDSRDRRGLGPRGGGLLCGGRLRAPSPRRPLFRLLGSGHRLRHDGRDRLRDGEGLGGRALVPPGPPRAGWPRWPPHHVPLNLEVVDPLLDPLKPLVVDPQRAHDRLADPRVLPLAVRVPPPRPPEAIARVAGLGTDRGDTPRLLFVVHLVADLVELQPHQPVLARLGALLVVGELGEQLREEAEDAQPLRAVLLGEDVFVVVAELGAGLEEGPRDLHGAALLAAARRHSRLRGTGRMAERLS